MSERRDFSAHGLTQDELVAIGRQTMSKNFRQAPMVFTRGEGMYVWDAAGRRYLDMVGGIAVNGLGHGHPRIVDAVTRQARQLFHVSNLYFNEPQVLLGQALSERFGSGAQAGRVYLCNSGAEANEAALKLARRYASKVLNEPKRSTIISFHQSFHGRTMFALAATGQPKYHDGFHPMVPGFKYATFNDIESVSELLDDTVCAVIVEPIQAEGGIIMPQPGFLAELRKLTRENKSLLILDEVQTGVGRTGSFFAYEQEGVKPDVVTLAKALGAGIPIGAMISSEACADGFAPGAHGSTFAGNALACRAALTVLDVMDDDNLLEHVTQTGAWFEEQLTQLCTRHACLDGTRGRGFIRALGFNEEWAPAAVERAANRGLLLNKLNTKTIRFLPPLIAQRSHIAAALDILAEVLTDLAASPPK